MSKACVNISTMVSLFVHWCWLWLHLCLTFLSLHRTCLNSKRNLSYSWATGFQSLHVAGSCSCHSCVSCISYFFLSLSIMKFGLSYQTKSLCQSAVIYEVYWMYVGSLGLTLQLRTTMEVLQWFSYWLYSLIEFESSSYLF